MLGQKHGGEPVPTKFGTPEYWQGRAEEARSMAAGMTNPDAKLAMLLAAESYENIAKRAEARDKGVKLTPPKDEAKHL